MSIWADIHKRSNGTAIRKEDKVIPEKNLQDIEHYIHQEIEHYINSKWNDDSGSEIYKKYYVSNLDDMLGNLEDDYSFFKF